MAQSICKLAVFVKILRNMLIRLIMLMSARAKVAQPTKLKLGTIPSYPNGLEIVNQKCTSCPFFSLKSFNYFVNLIRIAIQYKSKIFATLPGIEPGISCSVGRRLIHWAIEPDFDFTLNLVIDSALGA